MDQDIMMYFRTMKFMTWLLLLTTFLWADIKLTQSIDRTRLSLEDRINFVIEASGEEVGSTMPEPRMPKLQHFQLIDKRASTSTSSNIQIIINGRNMSQEAQRKTTWRYVLAPLTTGKLTLPPFVLNFKGKTYKTQPVVVEVVKHAVQNPDVIFKCIPQKTNVYLGEQFRCTFRIAIRRGANAYNPQRPNVEEGLRKSFWVEPLQKGEVKGTVKMFNGLQHEVFDLYFALYPIQTGSIRIPSFILQYEQRQRVRSRDPFFNDPFFGGLFGSGVRAIPKQKLSQPLQIVVQDLPPAPADFSGSVGKFSLSAKVDKNKVPAGEALTYTLLLSGNSSLRSIKDPIVPQVNRFDVFDPEKKTKTAIKANVVWGTREYKYVMIPQREGSFTIDPAQYVYFDTGTRSYKTIRTLPFKIRVTPGKQSTSLAAVRSPILSRQEIKEIGRDIRYIKTGNIQIRNAAAPLHRSAWFLILQAVPLLVMAGSFLYKRQHQKLTEDVGYARRSRSKRQVRKRLAQAKQALKQNQAPTYYSELSKGIVEYVGDVLNIAATGMTSDQIKKHLANAGQSQEWAHDVLTLLEKADFARFATSTVSPNEMSKDLKLAETLLSQFNPKKARKA